MHYGDNIYEIIAENIKREKETSYFTACIGRKGRCFRRYGEKLGKRKKGNESGNLSENCAGIGKYADSPASRKRTQGLYREVYLHDCGTQSSGDGICIIYAGADF